MSGGLLGELSETASADALRASLARVAWCRYRIGATDADDIVQAAVATYLEIHPRFARVSDHRPIVFGIFRKKCLEHIERSVREKKRLRRMCATPDAARENPWIRPTAPAQSPSVVEVLIRDEERAQILRAIEALRPSSRELVSLMINRGLGRRELIRLLRLNRSTLDSRLHVCRGELRRLLQKHSLHTMARRRPAGRRRYARRPDARVPGTLAS